MARYDYMKAMEKVSIQAITREYGCVVYTSITLPKDFTMSMLIEEVKRNEYMAFRLLDTDTMKSFIYV